MKDNRQDPMKAPFGDPPQKSPMTQRRRAYVPPELTTHDSESILQAIGPAHGIYGFVPGVATGGSL